MNDFLATSYVCIGENVLASNASTQGVVEVSVNNKIVTDYVKENGQGIDLDGLNNITIQFSNAQIIDSVVVLSDSNVKSYYISYTDLNGQAHVINDVIFFIFLKFIY
jgi:hypothetical protein